MKNKKALIVIIVLLIILAVCGGAFAYVYFATDLLKSNSKHNLEVLLFCLISSIVVTLLSNKSMLLDYSYIKKIV